MDETYIWDDLVEADPRYHGEAYLLVRDALAFALDVLKMGQPSEEAEPSIERGECHLTGQQLCEAIRLYALQQYGYMAKIVLRSWGISSTSDFGNLVYNMIDFGLMKKSDGDQKSDFDDVYDFDQVFDEQFTMELPTNMG